MIRIAPEAYIKNVYAKQLEAAKAGTSNRTTDIKNYKSNNDLISDQFNLLGPVYIENRLIQFKTDQIFRYQNNLQTLRFLVQVERFKQRC